MLETINLLYENQEISKDVRDILVTKLIQSTKDDLRKYIEKERVGFNEPLRSEELLPYMNHLEKIIFSSEGFVESTQSKEDIIDSWQQIKSTIFKLYS